MRQMIGIAALAASMTAMPGAAVENLPDPTRPPAALGIPAGDLVASAGPVLQSILISGTRRHAIIDGRIVRVGDKVGGAQVAEIKQGEVVLKDEKQSQTLHLFPPTDGAVSISRVEAQKEGAAAKKGK